MPDFISTLLWPIKWVIEAILVAFHTLWTTVGLDPDAGLTWVLSIVGLVLVVRAALIPIFVRQIKSQRRMMEVAPQLKKIQDKYKGKKDQFSREAMSRETMEMYKKTGTNPLSSCLPLLLQMPIFFGLFSVLSNAQNPAIEKGVGLLNADLSRSFGDSSLFDIAPLHLAISTANGNVAVIVIAVVMVILMTGSQFITQLQIMSKNQSAEMKASPMYRQQRILLYILPLVFLFSGFTFPLGVMFYWLVSNFWTMGQQFLVIRNMPTPGSEAALAREARLAKKRQRKGLPPEDESSTTGTLLEEPKKTTQRQQPVGKNRAKKKNREQQVSDATQTDTIDETAESIETNDTPTASQLEEEGDIAADYIEELLDIADLDGDIEIDARGGRAYLSVTSSEDTNLRVLSRPETVNALQELTRIAVQTKTGGFSRLILDIGGSREARVTELGLLVDKASEKIEAGADSAALPPMSSYERKIVHDIVSERGLTSESEGEGRDRHTVIRRA